MALRFLVCSVAWHLFFFLGAALPGGALVGQGTIPNECCPDPVCAIASSGSQADTHDPGAGETTASVFGAVTRHVPMPPVEDGMHGLARLYHATLQVDLSYSFWAGGASIKGELPVPPMGEAQLGNVEKVQPRPGTMPGLYLWEPNGENDHLYHYGSPIESGASPATTAIYSPPSSLVPQEPTVQNPVVYTNQLTGAQLWHFGDYIEVRHVDGSIARFDDFNPYNQAQQGTLWHVVWVRDPYDNAASYVYDGYHRLTRIEFPTGLSQVFDYAPTSGGWSSWAVGYSKLEISYAPTGNLQTPLAGRTWGLVFSTAGPTGGKHFGSWLYRTYSPQRRVLLDPSGSGPHTITVSSTVDGQIVGEIDYATSPSPVVIETQHVHTGSVFGMTLQDPTGLAPVPVTAVSFDSSSRRVVGMTDCITQAAITIGSTTTPTATMRTAQQEMPPVGPLLATMVTDALGATRVYEYDYSTGQVYTEIITPSSDFHGRPRVAHATGENYGIDGVAADDVEPEHIMVYKVFDASCGCQKPSEVRIISTRDDHDYVRTTQFDYFADSRLLKKRTELNPATVPSPPDATVSWEYTYTRAMSGSDVWGAWLPLQETTPDGAWTYAYTNWLARTDATQHGRIAGTVTRQMVGVRLAGSLDGTQSATTTVSEVLHRNLSNAPSGLAQEGVIKGQPRKVIDGDGVYTVFSYSSEGWLQDVYEHNGTVQRHHTFDGSGNVTSIEDNKSATANLRALVSFPEQSGFGLVYKASSSSGGLSRSSEFYYDRFGHLSVMRRKNLDSTGVKPSQHGGTNANAREWVETQRLFLHHWLEEVYEDRNPLDLGVQFLHRSYSYLANGRLDVVTNPNGSTTEYDFDGYGTLYRSITRSPTGGSLVSSPKTFINPFLEVTGSYQKSGSDHLWTTITRNAAGAITQIIEPQTTAPAYYSGSTGGAKHFFEIDQMGRVVEARAYAGVNGTLMAKRELRHDQLGRQYWQNDHLVGGTGNHYAVWRYAAGKTSQLASVEQTGIGATSYQYDAAGGFLSGTLDALGNEVEYGYFGGTAFRQSVERTDQGPVQDRVTTILYEVDPFGRVTKVRDGGQLDHVYAYNSLGQVDRYTDPAGRVQKFLPDALGRITEHVRLGNAPDNIRNWTVFDDFGASGTDGRTKVTRYDGLDNVTIEHRDFAGRPFIVQNPGGNTAPTPADKNTSMCLYAEYDEASRVTAVYDGDEGKTSFFRDGGGRPIVRELTVTGAKIALWNTRDILKRDALGRLEDLKHYGSTEAPANVPNQGIWVGDEHFQQDSLGRTLEESFKFGFLSSTVNLVSTNWVKNLSSFTGGNRLRQGLTYDDTLSTTLAMSYNHDTMGRLTSIGWNGGASTLASYGWVGGLRQTRTVNNSATVHTDTAYGYDDYGRLLLIHDNISKTTEQNDNRFVYVYDEASNLVKEKYAKVNGGVGDRFAYDAYHRLAAAWMGVSQTTMDQDPGPTGWVAGEMHQYLTYGLDAANNRTSTGTTTSGGTANIAYMRQGSGHPQGPSNRYDTVGISTPPVVMEYDNRGNLTFDGTFHYRYDFLNRLQEVWKIKPVVVVEEGEVYAVPEETALDDSADDVMMSVPDLVQRLPRDHMDPVFRARLKAQITGGVLRLYPSTQGGGTTMQSTAADAELELVAVYVYDAFNRRTASIVIGVETQYHAWDGWRQTGQFAPAWYPTVTSVPTKQFVWGSRLDELVSYRRKVGAVWENYFVLHGGQDTSAKLVNAAGDIVEQYEYDPYGKATVFTKSGSTWVQSGQSQYGLPFLWKSIRMDVETGLLYMRNRYYSTVLGRFLTRDPIGVWGDAINNGCEYSYVGERPLHVGDPLGLFASRWHDNITREALKDKGLSDDCIQDIIDGNVGQDDGASTNSGPFADGKNHADGNEIGGTICRMDDRARCVACAKCEDCPALRKLLAEIGKIMHALQDLYAHTDYVERHGGALPGGGGKGAAEIGDVPLWDLFNSDGSVNIPTNVTSGNYKWPSDDAKGPSHAGYAKDHSGYPRSRLTNAIGRTNFALAVDVATRHTAQLWDVMAPKLPSDWLEKCCKKDKKEAKKP